MGFAHSGFHKDTLLLVVLREIDLPILGSNTLPDSDA